MTNLDVAGILQSYAEKARKARNKETLKEIIKDLRGELDLRRLEDNK